MTPDIALLYTVFSMGIAVGIVIGMLGTLRVLSGGLRRELGRLEVRLRRTVEQLDDLDPVERARRRDRMRSEWERFSDDPYIPPDPD